MSPSVRISLRAAHQLRYIIEKSGYSQPAETHRELVSAIAKAERSKSRRVESHKPKKAERAAKRDETATIRAACMQRAQERCECGCNRNFAGFLGHATLDHFEGRANSESIETCWILRADCHQRKTNCFPTSAVWLSRFVIHCDRYGYSAPAASAMAKLESEALLQEAEGKR